MQASVTKKEINSTLTKAKLLFFLGVTMVATSPFFLTKGNFIKGLDFSNTGAIGDTIGGITSPFVNILGAVLVYYALKAQTQANLAVQQQIEAQSLREAVQNQSSKVTKLYTNLKDSIDNFTFSTLEPLDFGEKQPLKGSEAIYKLFQDFYCDYHGDESDMNCNPKILEIISILEICNSILTLLNKIDIPDKDVMTTLTIHQFQYRIAPRINLSIDDLNKRFCSSCNQEHGLPERIITLINSIKHNSNNAALTMNIY